MLSIKNITYKIIRLIQLTNKNNADSNIWADDQEPPKKLKINR